MTTENDVIQFIKEKGLSNSIVCLHSSLRSFGQLDNGPHTIIDAFIKEKCTLVCPAFFYESRTFPPRENYRRNGINFTEIEKMVSVSYNDDCNQIEPSMGIIPKTMLTYKNAKRTRNPGNSFVILGESANDILKDEALLNAYSVYKNIYNGNSKAFIMLAGVDFTSCTPIHFAEEVAGRKLFRRWAVYNHKIVEIEEGSCSDGFENIRKYTRVIENAGSIGQSAIRIYPFNLFIDKASKTIKNIPDVTHCDTENCERCNDMVHGGRIV
jgi:aminoglycoside 3-N-acetyltransferase